MIRGLNVGPDLASALLCVQYYTVPIKRKYFQYLKSETFV
jgi:hypothetical protein